MIDPVCIEQQLADHHARVEAVNRNGWRRPLTPKIERGPSGGSPLVPAPDVRFQPLRRIRAWSIVATLMGKPS